jgi:hypothetical protein
MFTQPRAWVYSSNRFRKTCERVDKSPNKFKLLKNTDFA